MTTSLTIARNSKIVSLILNNRIKQIEKLIKEGHRFETKGDEKTALIVACKYRNREIASKIIDAGYDLNKKSKLGFTALMIACKQGLTNITSKLIEYQCNLDLQSNKGYTALMIACINNRKYLVYRLIEVGCNLSLQNDKQYTYEEYVKKDMKAMIKKALKARENYKIFSRKLFGICVKYIRKNINDFQEDALMNLNRDIRCYFIKKN